MLGFVGDSCFLKTDWSWNQVCCIISSLRSSLSFAIAREISGTKGDPFGKTYRGKEEEGNQQRSVWGHDHIYGPTYKNLLTSEDRSI